MGTVYILQSATDGRFYVGSTKELSKRLAHHAGGHTPSTRRMGKLKVVFTQTFPTLTIARNIERRLKKLKRKDYIEMIIREGSIRMNGRLAQR